MRKIKVLFSTEFSGVCSGFGTYTKELFNRLVQDDRLKLAEFSMGCNVESDISHCKWIVYPASVTPNDPRYSQLCQSEQNRFGAWRFGRTLLDFQPDVVCNLKDPWMFMHECNHVLRPYFYQILMPTVDSAPQQTEWIDAYGRADAVLTYSDWAKPVIERQSDKVNLVGSAYPGIELDIFKPIDKKKARKAFGISEDWYIVGTVMRNQPRKLFPDLFKSFRMYLDKYGDTEVGKKTYLYVHTSFPDQGWEIPELLMEYGISNRVLFTYICKETRRPYCSFYEGAISYSTASNNITSVFPNVGDGLAREQLALVYNVMDLYVQYSNCEGSGMPSLEASGCGIPVAAPNYSAMGDVVEKTKGYPLDYVSIRDPGVNAWRACPINEQLVELMFDYYRQTPEYKKQASDNARQAAIKYFNWDITAKVWSDTILNADLSSVKKWDGPPMTHNISEPSISDKLSNSQFVYSICNHFCMPELFTSFRGLHMVKQLQWGVTDRESIKKDVMALAKNRFKLDRARCKIEQMVSEDYCDFAHLMESIV